MGNVELGSPRNVGRWRGGGPCPSRSENLDRVDGSIAAPPGRVAGIGSRGKYL
jgi:hypothetical protein